MFFYSSKAVGGNSLFVIRAGAGIWKTFTKEYVSLYSFETQLLPKDYRKPCKCIGKED